MKTNRLQPIISNTNDGEQVEGSNGAAQVENPEKMPETPAAPAETKTTETKTKDQQSGKFDWNEGLKTVGDTLVGIFRKPNNITNNTITMTEDDDNTMLYVGLGGALLLVVLLIVFLR